MSEPIDAHDFFATEWPRVAVRLRRVLARHGVPAGDRDDVVQETALRLYRAWPTVDQSRGVDAFACTIALNVHRDLVRRNAYRGEVLGDVPDTGDAGDTVERTTLARLELGRVRRALLALRPAERRVLSEAFAAAVDGEPAVTPASVRMARMRARRQLAAVLKTASAVVAAVVTGVRALRGQRAVPLATGVALVVAATLLPHLPAAPADVALSPAESRQTVHARDDLPARRVVTARTRSTTTTGDVRAAVRRRHVTPPVRAAHIEIPVAEVDVLAEVEVSVLKVQVRDRSERTPACVATPLADLDDRVECS